MTEVIICKLLPKDGVFDALHYGHVFYKQAEEMALAECDQYRYTQHVNTDLYHAVRQLAASMSKGGKPND